ncbi:MAG: hypothetical protein PVG65_02700 [Candidatus Thorarchaeota archaeon]
MKVIDIIHGLLLVGMLVLIAFILFQNWPQGDTFVCFDKNVRPGYGQYVEVTNCRYENYQYHCNEGIFNYCHKGHLETK